MSQSVNIKSGTEARLGLWDEVERTKLGNGNGHDDAKVMAAT